MRKGQKQEVLEFIESLHQANGEIKKALERNNKTLAQNMLAECQEYAVELGNSIEKLEGQDAVTVSYIEEYCDILYHIHEDLNDVNCNCNKFYKKLEKYLIRVENSAKSDIRVRKEIVFFPYKASMWDSLESIYLAAKEAPDCDAYCVPIPYYDMNPDRTLGHMHYEGLDYPPNIDVIDYKTYDFEERRPDEIYIHNPYDSWNLVTQVPERFFSSNLKKFTDKLVYIPYFILGEIEPDDQASIDGMKHFIWTPGVINADQVIVQSEKMKKIYVNEYLKFAEEAGLQGSHIDRKYLEHKILGLGSPKIEKVLNTKKDDLEIPEEWLKVIQKPDGSWKKIVFYNTGISALLRYGEKWVDKIEASLKEFRENQDEVVLLWRPHPLIENAIKSMRPQVLQRYVCIKSQYIQEGWGIYDDTADMDRAVILSDAYYGDISSVANLYMKKGKKMMFQNIDSRAGYINPNLSVVVNEDIYFTNADKCELYRLRNGKLEFLTKFYNDKKNISPVLRGLNYKDKIIFTPNINNIIFIYSIQENKFEEIVLNRKEKYICNVAVIYQDELILVDAAYKCPMLIRVDILQNKIIEYQEIPLQHNYDKKVNSGWKYEVNVICQDCVILNNKLYIANSIDSAIIEYDLQNSIFETYTLKEIENGIMTLSYGGGKFWISDRWGNIFSWEKERKLIGQLSGEAVKNNKISNIINPYLEKKVGYTISNYAYNRSIKIGDRIFFIPGKAKKILSLNLTTGDIETLPLEIEHDFQDMYTSSYVTGISNDMYKIICYLPVHNKLLEITENNCNLLDNDLENIENMEMLLDSYNIINENACFSLNKFIERIVINGVSQ